MCGSAMKRGLSLRTVTGVLWVALTLLTPAIARPPSPHSPPSSSSPPSPASPAPSDGCLNTTSPTSDLVSQATNKSSTKNEFKDVAIVAAGFKLSSLQNVSDSEIPESTLPYPVFRSTTRSSGRSTTTTSRTTTNNRLGQYYRIPDQSLPHADEDNYFDYYYEEPDDSFTTMGQQQPPGDGHSLDGGHQPPPGLNRVAKLKLLKMPRRQPPEYMLELYDRFSKASTPVTRRTPKEGAEAEDKSSLGADIVRSFPNINKEVADANNTDDGGEVTGDNDDNNKGDDIDNDNETSQQLPGRETRHHTLVFNITSLLVGEEVSHAELRLYTLVEQDRNTFVGDNREVRVYEGLGRATNPHRAPVASRHVYGRSGGWEAFDVTSVVQSWVRKGPRTFGDDGVHVLEVKIDSVFHELRGKGGTGRGGLAMDIDVDPEHNEGPLLVVFSRDTSWQLQRQRQLQEIISHEPPYDGDEVEQDTKTDDDVGFDSSKTIAGDSDTTESDETVASRRKSTRSRPTSRNGQPVLSKPTQRAPLFSKPPASELFGLPAVSARAEAEAEGEGKQVALTRVRRDKRRRNGCRRKTLYVDFQDINWHQWIIAPQGYMAFECEGRCFIPIGSHLSPTNHAIIQTLVHGVQPKRASRACCVPTKLEPISILYLDENHVITYKYNYDDMVVTECGCR